MTKKNMRQEAKKVLQNSQSAIQQYQDVQDYAKLVEELQIHQIELTMQNQELISMQVKLEANQQRYADLFNFAPIGYFRFDSNGLIVELNYAAAELLQKDPKQLINRTLLPYLDQNSIDVFNNHLQKVKDCDQPVTCELKIYPQGLATEPLYLQVRTILIVEQTDEETETRTILSTMMDITERRKAKQQLSNYRDQLEVLVEERTTELQLTNQRLHEEIQERHQAETQLKSANERLAHLLQYSPAIIYSIDVNSNEFTYFSQNTEMLLGYPIEELTGSWNFWHSLYHPDDIPDLATKWRLLLKNGAGIMEHRIQTKQGDYIWLYIEARVLYDAQNQPVEIVGSMIPITERVEAELALKQSEAQMKEVFQKAPVGICITDEAGYYTFANQSYAEIYGYTISEFIGQPFTMVLPEADRADATAMYKQFFANEMALPREWVVKHKNGNLLTIIVDAALFYDIESKPYKVTFIIDISERKQLEEQLQSSQAFLNETQQIASIGGWEFDIYQDSMRWTAEMFNLYELPADSQPNMETMLSFYAPNSQKQITEAVETLLTEEKSYDLVLDFITNTGKKLHVRSIGHPHSDTVDNDKLVKVSGIVQDITQQEKAKQALQESERKFRTLLQQAPEAVIITNKKGIIQIVNKQVEQLFGYTQKELIGQSVEFLVPENLRENHPQMRRNYIKTPYARPMGEEGVDLEARRKDGSVFPIEASLTTIESQQKVLVMTYIMDITERRRAELTLKQMNEMLEQLAMMDGLTRLANRRRFDDHLDEWWARMKQTRQPLSLALCDIDYFKNFNDTYGHQAGDDCLQKIGLVINQVSAGPHNLAARYGGEEFAIILPNTSPQMALQRARMLQQEIRELRIVHTQSEVSQHITLSIGLATIIPSPQHAIEQFIKTTDEALYEAKNQGRNRIICKRVI